MQPKFMNAPFDIKKDFYEQKEKPKSEKEYLVLLTYNDGTGDKSFSFIKGQAGTREYLIENIADINLDESYVLVEDVEFVDGVLTVYNFLKLMEADYHDGFDVDDYLLHKDTGNGEEEARLLDSGDAIETNQGQQADNLFLNSTQVEELL